MALLNSPLVEFDFADVKVANTAFKPLVREQKFDLGELAIVTYLQAKAAGKPYVLLPAVIVGRGQHHTIAYNSERGHADARRSARQTRGRARLHARPPEPGCAASCPKITAWTSASVRWITFEEPHVAEYRDPEIVERAPAAERVAPCCSRASWTRRFSPTNSPIRA
jgi:4,5-dihydroxyphthalate decarboxylase